MVRKHFQTQAQGQINNGQLIRLGLDYYVRYMNDKDLPQSLALQSHVLQTLKKLGKTHYIIEKDKAYLQQVIARGDAIIGTFVKDQDPAKPDRLAAHMLVVYPTNDAETGLADPQIVPDKDLGNISVVSNILVHQDFRGNKLMQQMLDEWLAIARTDGKSHAVAEVCTDNEFSWSIFLDCGFVIYAAEQDPRDGSDIVYVHKPLNHEFLYSKKPKDMMTLKLFDAQGDLDSAAQKQMEAALKKNFHVITYDKKTKLILMAKCVGTVPLPQAGNAPPSSSPPAGNDNPDPAP